MPVGGRTENALICIQRARLPYGGAGCGTSAYEATATLGRLVALG